MIEMFRSFKDSVFMKIFLGLLAASFGIWGVGDFMSGSNLTPGVSIKVGSTEIKTSAVQRQFNRDLERFRESMQGREIPEEIMKRTVMSTTVQQMTKSATLSEAARQVGLHVSQDQLREAVFQQKPFLVDGKFNRLQFEQLLANNNLTESAYLSLFEADMRQLMLMQPVVVNADAPKYLVDSLFHYRNETRVADTLLIQTTAMALQAAPTDDELKAIYDKNIATFTAPEYRKVTVLTLSASDLVKAESIDDEQAKAYYDENLARYRTSETKRVSQIIFDSKEKAEAARAQAAKGESLEALATKTKSGPAVDLGDLSATSPLISMLGADAFKTAVGEISQPVQSPLGWHLIEVKAINPESVKPFESVKETVKATIAADKGNDAVYGASVQLEDAIAAGTPLADVAKSVGGQIVQIASIDQDGKDKNGVNVKNTIDPKSLVKTIFETPAGKDSRLMDLGARDGYYVVHVDEVTAPTPKPLIDVRAQVASLWEGEEKQKAAQALADKLAAEIGPSSQLSAIEAKDKRAAYAPLGPITRFGEGLDPKNVVDSKRLSTEVLDKLFKAKSGDVFVAPVQNGVLIARLKDISAPTASGPQAATQEQLAQSIRNDIGSNLMDQLTKSFTMRWPPEVDQKSLESMTTSR